MVLIVNHNYEVSDYTLYALGLMDTDQLRDAIIDAQQTLADGGTVEDTDIAQDEASYSYDDLMGLDLRLVLPTDKYEKSGDGYVDQGEQNQRNAVVAEYLIQGPQQPGKGDEDNFHSLPPVVTCFPALRHRIKVVPLVKRVTPKKPSYRQKSASRCAVFFNCFHCIGGAGRRKSAAGRKQGRDLIPVKSDQKQHRPLHRPSPF